MTYTNNVPCGSYRAPGEPQAVFAVESHTDMIAGEMGLDPYELRLKNLVHEGDISATGQLFHHVRAEETLRRAAESSSWGVRRKGAYFGRGIALGQRPPAGSVSTRRVTLDEHAKATLYSPVPDTGVGSQTVGRQFVAEDLGIPPEDVGVINLATDDIQFDRGAGAASSRVAGYAALRAAQEVRRKLTGLAAEFYGWPEERIVFQEGRVFVDGDPEKGVPIRELAAKCVAALGGPISSGEVLGAWIDELGIARDLLDEKIRNPDAITDNELFLYLIGHLTRNQVYHGGQKRGFNTGAVWSPGEVMEDLHVEERRFWTEVQYPELEKKFRHPGHGGIFSRSPWKISRRAPLIGEHNGEVLCGELGLSRAELAVLAEGNVI